MVKTRNLEVKVHSGEMALSSLTLSPARLRSTLCFRSIQAFRFMRRNASVQRTAPAMRGGLRRKRKSHAGRSVVPVPLLSLEASGRTHQR